MTGSLDHNPLLQKFHLGETGSIKGVNVKDIRD